MATRRLSAPFAAHFAVCVLGPYQVGAAAVPAAPTSAVATPGTSGASAVAPWYDTLWTRRDTITVEGSSAGAQTNYPVKLTIPYDAAMKADFSDLRFTDSSGTLLLSYWVESETNSTSALVWVKIPSVPIAPGTVVFYVYYGNPAAVSMSNGDTTFTLFDTFGAGGTPGDWNYTNNVIGEHAIIRNGKLYAPLYDSDFGVNGGLVVLNPINGDVIKRFTIPGFCTAAAPAFDKNGFLHVYDCGGFIKKLDENTGTVLQSRSIGSALDWEAVPYDPVNDILLIASQDDHSLSAIRASDYSLVWRNTDVDLTYGSSEVAPPLIVGAYVYWQDYSAKLYKISLSTGITVASTPATTVGFPATPYSFSSYSQIIYDSVNNRLYLTNSTGHTAFAINPADLSVAWSKVVESDGWNFNRGGAWHNNVWYVTARETGYPYRSKIYALNTQNSGSILWTNTTAYDNGAEVSSILADDNYVYAGTYDYTDQDYNKLLILNALDGSVASTIQLLNGVASSIPTFYGGKIIMGLWYDTSGQQVGGYQALQVRDGGGTDDFYYKADLNQTGYVGAFASGPLTARTACAYGLLDPTKWIASGIYSITNCAAVSTVNSFSWSNSFKSTLTFGRANTAIRVRARNSEPSSNSWDAYLGFTNTMGSCLPVCFGRNNGQMVLGYDQNGTQQAVLGPAYAFNQYNTAEVKMAYPSIQFDVNDSNLAASASWSTGYDRLPIQLGNFKGSATVDWVLVRNYVNPEPTIISSLCSYQLSGNSAYASSAANGTVTVSTNPACNWSGASNSAFLHITSGASGFGNGQVNISIDANATSSQRTGTLTLAGLTFTITQDAAVSISIAKTHAGNFTQGQTGATYTVTVSNATGAGPTSGTVTVTEIVPAGLTLVSMNGGATWNCTVPPNCTTSSVLNGGRSYPVITVTVNVAENATSPQVNAVAVSGGRSAGANTADATVIAAGIFKAVMSTPVPGSVLSGTSVTFTWTPGTGATAYWLDVGTVQGQGSIFAAQLASSVTSQAVNGIPTNGGSVYVRLWTQLSGVWQYNDYSYTAANLGTLAAMSNPAPGSTLGGSAVTFTWSVGTGATAYWLDVGTVQGQGNIFAAQLASSVTSQAVNGIPTNGGAIYVRLCTKNSVIRQNHDNSFTAANLGTLAAVSIPAPGSTFSGSAVTFTWSVGTGATAYWLDVGTVQGQGNIFAAQLAPSVTSQAVNGIPTNGGTIYVRLWTQLSGIWQYHDYSYSAANFGTLAAMSNPAPGSTLSGSAVTFTWSAGTGATAYWLDVGTVQGQGNIFASQLASSVLSQTVSGIPSNGSTIYVRLWSQLNGAWQYNDYTYTVANPGTLAAMSSPAPGSAFNGSSVTFTWTAGTGASAYWLDVGTIQGQGNIFAGQLAPSVTSQTVNGIPTNGGTIYVRLWSQISGAWQYHDYIYTAH